MDEIVLGGSKYVTSTKAAKIVGYSSDYISRLCRTGKLKGYLAGRVWFVELASLAQTFQDQSRSDPDYYEDAVRRLGDNLAPPRYENDNGPIAHPLVAKASVGDIAKDAPLIPARYSTSPSILRWASTPVALALSLVVLSTVFVASVEEYSKAAHAEERSVSQQFALVWPFDAAGVHALVDTAGQELLRGVEMLRIACSDTVAAGRSFSVDTARGAASLLSDVRSAPRGALAAAGSVRDTAEDVAVGIYCSISQFFGLASCADGQAQDAGDFEAQEARDRLYAQGAASTTPEATQQAPTPVAGQGSGSAGVTYVTNQPVIERILERVIETPVAVAGTGDWKTALEARECQVSCVSDRCGSYRLYPGGTCDDDDQA